MTTRRGKSSVSKLRALWLLCAVWLLASCAATGPKPPASVSHVAKDELPTRLAVLPVRFLPVKKRIAGDFPVDGASDKGKFIGALVRGVVHNQLAGKGYEMEVLRQVDRRLGASNWKKMSAKELCAKLDVDGVIYPEIASATMVSAVAYNFYKVDAEIRMINKAGKQLGTWRDSASKRKISLPTSPLGAAATLLGALLDESARKQMRLVIYDWGWKVSQVVPDCPGGKSLPEVVSVDSNIDKGIVGVGQQIRVEVTAEKGLSCSFDLGDFKKGLPLSPSGGGVYKGAYVVQEGDHAANQPLTIHLVRPNGVERIWMETGGTVTIDGILPPAPQKVEAQAGKGGVSLTWGLPQGEDLKEFVVERSEKPVGDFTVVAQTKDVRYLDAGVSQGKTYYYRVEAVDPAGNRSARDKTVQVTMPFYHEVKLSGTLSGTLVPGLYRLDGEGRIAAGAVFAIGAGSHVTLGPEARIVADGTLKVTGSPQRPVVLEGRGWKGIAVTPQGQAQLTDAALKGCSSCLEADGAPATLRRVTVEGQQGDGLIVKDNGVLTLKKVEVSGCGRGVVVAGGKGRIDESTLSRNTVGLDMEDGDVALSDSNVFGNTQCDIRTRRKMVLEGNYLGASAVRDLKLEGDILVKSLLDAPFPHGRKVVLVEDKEITPEEIAKRFADYKAKGIKAFTERRFGDAYQELSQAAKLKNDRETYLYLAYTLSSLGEEKKMAATLERAIEAFPYEVRLYQVYVKYLAAHGKKDKALALLKRAMKMNPEDQNLAFMKQYVEALGK